MTFFVCLIVAANAYNIISIKYKMATNNNSPAVGNIDQGLEYYEEADDRTLEFRNRKAQQSKSLATVVRQPTQIIDPIKELNEQLNRQYRPDLVPPTPSPEPVPSPLLVPVPIVQQTPSPDPIIYDARIKPVKPPKEKKEPSISVKQKLLTRIHQLTAPAPEPTSYTPEMSYDQPTTDGYLVPPGMVLMPASQLQQQQKIPLTSKPSQKPQGHSFVSQYQPPNAGYSNSFKDNNVPPLLPIYNTQRGDQHVTHNSIDRSSSFVSINPLIQSNRRAQKQVYKTIDQSHINKNNSTKQSIPNPSNTHRSFALYNQQNGRVEGVVKNRLTVVGDGIDGDGINDGETEPKSKLALWLSQPLCLGLKRLTGGLLFGSMIILGAASFAGLIASIATYSRDSVNDAQWKILGMVVCAIMLITIIVTLIVFICCYKYGFMFNRDDDIDPDDGLPTHDAEGNERQKAVLRKIYKFNRPTDAASIHSGVIQDVSTTASIAQPTVFVKDIQTNTETTIARIRPKDFDRGVWPSTNAYGGIVYRPLIQPHMVSRFIQVLPHEIEETYQSRQVIYQVVEPVTREVQPRIIQIPAEQPSVAEVIETKQIQPRTTVVRQTQPTTRYEYVDIEEQRPARRIDQRPQYEIVEEVIEQSDASSVEEVYEVVNAPKHLRQRGRRKDKKRGVKTVSVKHIKPNGE